MMDNQVNEGNRSEGQNAYVIRKQPKTIERANKMKSYISAALLFAMILCSCGSGTTAGTPESSTTKPDTSETTANPLDDDLPEFNFGGEEFVMNALPAAVVSYVNVALDVETETGDELNDAIYRRNRTLEERFNFNLVIQEELASRRDIYHNSVLADDNSFDVFMLVDREALELAQEGMLTSYDKLEHINLEKPYWSQSMNQSLSICGNYYFAYSDFNLLPYDYTHMLVFNKQIIDDLQLENPYELVMSGEWTFDAYASMAKQAIADLDGNSKMDGNDQYGLLAASKQVLPGFWIGAGELSIENNENDEPEFNLASDEHFVDVIESIFNITLDNNSYYMNTASNNNDTGAQDMFKDGKGLFMDITFNGVTKLRDMNTNFGIIPYPKWDTAQENYYSRVEGGNVPMVPITSEKLEMTGVILEAMSSESAKTVIPAYYEKLLKGKVTRDDESMEMLDIIYGNRVYDLGDTYWCNTLRDGIFLQMFNGNDRAVASKIASVESTMKTQIQNTVEAFSKIN